MRLNSIGREANQLDTALGELRLELCESAELSGADGSVILGVREQDNPVVANELMEVDGTGRRFGFEVWGNGAQAEAESEKCQQTVKGGQICKL